MFLNAGRRLHPALLGACPYPGPGREIVWRAPGVFQLCRVSACSFRGVAPPAGKAGSTPVPSAFTIFRLRGRDAGARFPNRRDSIVSQEGGSMAARRQIRTFKPAACTKGIHHLYVGLKGSKLACLSRRLASG